MTFVQEILVFLAILGDLVAYLPNITDLDTIKQ